MGVESEDQKISASSIFAFAFGLAIGYGVWAAAPEVIGKHAPWEGDWPYYSTVLFTGSALVALVLPGQYIAVFFGAAIGQVLAEEILLNLDQQWLTTRYDWIGVLVTFPGTWIGSVVRGWFRKSRRSHGSPAG